MRPDGNSSAFSRSVNMGQRIFSQSSLRKSRNSRHARLDSESELVQLVELGFRGAGLGGDNGWGYNHSNEGEGYQEVMHGVISLAGVLQNSSTP